MVGFHIRVVAVVSTANVQQRIKPNIISALKFSHREITMDLIALTWWSLASLIFGILFLFVVELTIPFKKLEHRIIINDKKLLFPRFYPFMHNPCRYNWWSKIGKVYKRYAGKNSTFAFSK